MKKVKTKECTGCGCPRMLLIRAELYLTSSDSLARQTVGLKTLCFKCLLEVLKLKPLEKGTQDYQRTLACVSEDES